MSATFLPDGDALRFLLHSRGDMVRGRLVDTAPSHDRPLVVVTAPDGAADHPLIDWISEAWASWAAIASLDLPLCGARANPKFSDPLFDRDHPLARRIRADIEGQVGADLQQAVQLLGEREGAGGSRLAFVGFGEAAELARPFCSASKLFDLVAITPSPDDAWLEATAKKIRDLS